MPFRDIFRGKRVLVTGHTGFKGAWLSEWLLNLGAKVAGYGLQPSTKPSLFAQLDLSSRLMHVVGDIRDLSALCKFVNDFRPEFVFHLAAQPLVRKSYLSPVETYDTNVRGTVHLLEAIRMTSSPCVVVAVTSDKCYENREWVHSYREEDALGGYDPYSSSKAAAELVIAAYRRSFFSGPDTVIRLASARAGNVIGGGDWAEDRIVPDCIRFLQQKSAIEVRSPGATRPWQHVLEPTSGYLWLAASLFQNDAVQLRSAFNFGPSLESNRTVKDLVEAILRHWPGKWVDRSDLRALHEAGQLNLAADKAFHILRWKALWPFEQAVEKAVSWYQSAYMSGAGFDAKVCMNEQILLYVSQAEQAQLEWAN
jgi:CDP-glucose 4,6-dehydratase